MNSKLGYRPEIDGLRAVAVTGVLLCHYKVQWFAGGFAGVDVFFVISGYLITQLIHTEVAEGTFSFRAFYIRRARRLFPALFFTLFASFIAATLLFSPERLQAFSLSLIATMLSASNVLFWAHAGYFDAASNLKPLLHTWSLGVEEQFYLLWPACLFLLARWKLSTPVALLIAFAFSLAGNYLWQDHTSSIFYLLPFRLFEFAIGGSIVWLQCVKTTNLSRELMTIAGLTMIVAAYVLFSSTTPFPAFPALVPCIGAAMTILGGRSRFSGSVLGSRIPVAIGARSYSIYLAHWPLIVFYEYSIRGTLGWKGSISLSIITLIVASAMYSFVETPFRRKKNVSFQFMEARFATAAISLGILLVASSAGAWSTGWPWRLRPDQVQFVRDIGDVSSFKTMTYGGVGCDTQCDTHPDKPTMIYVMGDSHAQHYFYGFRIAFPEINTRIFTFSSCPFYSEEYTRDFSAYPDPARYDLGCREVRQAAFAKVRNSHALLIVSQDWENIPLISETTGRTLNTADMAEAATVVSRELSAMKRDLNINRLAVIGNAPGAIDRENFVDCMTRPSLGRAGCRKVVSEGDITRLRMIKINQELRSKLASVARFLDPFEALCDERSCRLVADGKPLYRDDSHLTKWGSELIMQTFQRRLDGLLQKIGS
jgi:peptidoglycan/LPS O-acetylase OafA/YrhL